MSSSALLLTASALASASDVEALTKANGGQAPAVATRSPALSPSDFASSSSSNFAIVRSLAATPAGHATAEGDGVLRNAAAALAPGGTLELVEELTEPLKRALLLAGFVEAAAAKKAEEGSGSPHITTAKKPEWSPSAAVALPAAKKEADSAAVSAWHVAAEAGDDAEEETIDEDALLAGDDDLKPKIKLDAEGKAVAAAPCPPTKSACKDCSCGRAEREAANGGKAEAAPRLTREMIENPQSNCGSCGLGDAFRCGGCPYRGLPPFQPGKKIELPADFLIADT